MFSLFLGPCLTGYSQGAEIDVNFTALKEGGVIQLAWRMSAGLTCNGIQIQRSLDGENFQDIGDIQGVCGSPDVAISYTFTDDNPVSNQTNFYRLILGQVGQSNTISVEFIDLQGTGLQVRPNPIVDTGIIYFENSRGENYVLSIFSVSGLRIDERSTRNDFFEIDLTGQNAGVYPFRIIREDGEREVSGKIVLSR